MNQVFETETFTKLFDACDHSEQIWIDKMRDQLQENLRVGKPLRFDWLREKKFGVKRLYYLINESNQKAVLVAFGPKKKQQPIITHIVVNKARYLHIIA